MFYILFLNTFKVYDRVSLVIKNNNSVMNLAKISCKRLLWLKTLLNIGININMALAFTFANSVSTQQIIQKMEVIWSICCL